MKGLKDFLPLLLLLAVATRAIPLPEPRSIMMVSAHEAAFEKDGMEEGAFDKREIRGDLDTAEETESTTEVAAKTEEPIESDSAAEPEKEEEGMEEVDESPVEEEETDVATTTGDAGEVHDGASEEEIKPAEEEMSPAEEGARPPEEEMRPAEDEMKPAEEELEEIPAEEEGKAQEKQTTTEEVKADTPEEPVVGKKVAEEEKVDGRIGEVDKPDSGEGMPAIGQEEDVGVQPVVPPEEGPVFALPIDHPSHGPIPWPWSPLPLDLPNDGFPDHPVQQVGNEVQPQPKVIFPIYFIRIDHRILPESPYQGL